MGGLVKLHIQQHVTKDETIIENVKAKTWDDFVIVTFNGDYDDLDRLKTSIGNYAEQHPEKQVLLLMDTTRIDFYGIETEQEEPLEDQATETEPDSGDGSDVPGDEIRSESGPHRPDGHKRADA